MQVWEKTDLLTADGEPVDRPACDEVPGWDQNNYAETPVTLPLPGEGMVTAPCTRGQLGPRRNCGFAYDGVLVSCAPGKKVQVTCSTAAGAAPQAVRLCEGSRVLGSGVACVDQDALGSAVVFDGEPETITLKCPGPRDEDETGGVFAVYRGAVWPEDETAEVNCTVD